MGESVVRVHHRVLRLGEHVRAEHIYLNATAHVPAVEPASAAKLCGSRHDRSPQEGVAARRYYVACPVDEGHEVREMRRIAAGERVQNRIQMALAIEGNAEQQVSIERPTFVFGQTEQLVSRLSARP